MTNVCDMCGSNEATVGGSIRCKACRNLSFEQYQTGLAEAEAEGFPASARCDKCSGSWLMKYPYRNQPCPHCNKEDVR